MPQLGKVCATQTDHMSDTHDNGERKLAPGRVVYS